MPRTVTTQRPITTYRYAQRGSITKQRGRVYGPNWRDLYDYIGVKFGIGRRNALDLLATAFDYIAETTLEGRGSSFHIPGFGTFRAYDASETVERHVPSGQRVPRYRYLKFKVSSARMVRLEEEE